MLYSSRFFRKQQSNSNFVENSFVRLISEPKRKKGLYNSSALKTDADSIIGMYYCGRENTSTLGDTCE